MKLAALLEVDMITNELADSKYLSRVGKGISYMHTIKRLDSRSWELKLGFGASKRIDRALPCVSKSSLCPLLPHTHCGIICNRMGRYSSAPVWSRLVPA